jgi:hypothetical protein
MSSIYKGRSIAQVFKYSSIFKRTMAIKTSPIPYPAGTSPLLANSQFGVVVEGVKPAELSPEQLKE